MSCHARKTREGKKETQLTHAKSANESLCGIHCELRMFFKHGHMQMAQNRMKVTATEQGGPWRKGRVSKAFRLPHLVRDLVNHPRMTWIKSLPEAWLEKRLLDQKAPWIKSGAVMIETA